MSKSAEAHQPTCFVVITYLSQQSRLMVKYGVRFMREEDGFVGSNKEAVGCFGSER